MIFVLSPKENKNIIKITSSPNVPLNKQKFKSDQPAEPFNLHYFTPNRKNIYSNIDNELKSYKLPTHDRCYAISIGDLLYKLDYMKIPWEDDLTLLKYKNRNDMINTLYNRVTDKTTKIFDKISKYDVNSRFVIQQKHNKVNVSIARCTNNMNSGFFEMIAGGENSWYSNTANDREMRKHEKYITGTIYFIIINIRKFKKLIAKYNKNYYCLKMTLEHFKEDTLRFKHEMLETEKNLEELLKNYNWLL